MHTYRLEDLAVIRDVAMQQKVSCRIIMLSCWLPLPGNPNHRKTVDIHTVIYTR